MSSKSLKQNILNLIAHVVSIPAAIILLPGKAFGFRILRMRSSRIGHLAGNTELYLRKVQLGLENRNKDCTIFIATKAVANLQLFSMFSRQVRIAQVPQPKIIQALTKAMATNTILAKWGLFRELPFSHNEYWEFNHGTPSLSFTPTELERGRELLTKMGVHGWYVCFHSRDSQYLDGLWDDGDRCHEFRNCSIENYLPAASWLAAQGGWTLRMGAAVATSTLPVHESRIIDYAAAFRSDFGDIYLPAHCHFFLGNTAGLYDIAQIFNVPSAIANVIPLTFPPLREEDLFIPKTIFSEPKGRLLTFREIIESDVINYTKTEQYDRAGLKVIENNGEEILDLAQEMHQRLEGTWKSTAEDEELQAKYKSLFGSTMRCYGFPSRVGAKFLRKYRQLLE